MASKQISIRRRETRNQILPATVIASSKKFLGAVLEGRAPLKGVEGDEEVRLLSRLLGIRKEDADFSKRCREFWVNMRLEVSHDGVVLEIGTDDDGDPLNVSDYLHYKWALKHKHVASSQEAMYADASKLFYLHDPDVALSKAANTVKGRAEAYHQLGLIRNDRPRVNLILRLLGELEPEKMGEDAALTTLDTHIMNNPNRFVAICTDKNAPIKDLILRMERSEVLRKVGNSYFFGDEKLGSDLDEAILFLRDPVNNDVLVALRGKMANLGTSISLEDFGTKKAAQKESKASSPAPAETDASEKAGAAEL